MASEGNNYTPQPNDIPVPIVTFSRWLYALTLGGAFVVQQPLITTALLLIVLVSVFGGKRWNLISRIGRILFSKQIAVGKREDYRLIRFNNLIVVALLVIAQVGFVVNASAVAWVSVIAIVVASSLALAGFCVGCVLYYQFKLQRFRLLGQ